QKELEGLPAVIDTTEKNIAELHRQLADPQFYSQPPTAIVTAKDHLAACETKLQQLMERWEELESRTTASQGG
ncbi:MAG: ABC transporter ATP-binding protein, partial [Pirellulaceae bacterium]